MSRYVVIIEPTATGFSAYLPDVPGCVATGRTREQVEQRMREAMREHLEILRADGQPVPKALTSATFIDVAA